MSWPWMPSSPNEMMPPRSSPTSTASSIPIGCGHQSSPTRRPGDPLTLAQGGVIAAFKDTLLVGQGPRLAGLDPNDGDVRWEVAVGTPRGTNEVERLADLVAQQLGLSTTQTTLSSLPKGTYYWRIIIHGGTGPDSWQLPYDPYEEIVIN